MAEAAAHIFSLAAFTWERTARLGGEGKSLVVMGAPFLAAVAITTTVLAGAPIARFLQDQAHGAPNDGLA